MNPHDAYYQRAMRDLYASSHAAHLNAQQMSDLLIVAERYRHLDHEDCWHAAVGELRPDGVTVCRPLTLARLDAWVDETWQGRRSPGFSMAPPKVTA